MALATTLIEPNSSNAPQFDNAYQTLTDGDFQEWLTGFEFSMPIGMREGFSAVRNAELQLARERAVLEKQEQAIEHDLAGAVRELYRAYAVSQTNYNAWLKSGERVDAINRAIDAGLITADDQLDAQRDLSEAEVRYFRALVEYNLAIKAVNLQKGALLDYCGVELSEGPWPRRAYDDAREQARRRSAALHLDYTYTNPKPISRGPVPQGVQAGTEMMPGVPPEALPEAIPQPLEMLPRAASLGDSSAGGSTDLRTACLTGRSSKPCGYARGTVLSGREPRGRSRRRGAAAIRARGWSPQPCTERGAEQRDECRRTNRVR